MSQAGGPSGEVGRVNIAFDGSTEGLEAAAGKAVAVAQKAAQDAAKSSNFTVTNLKDTPIGGDANAHAEAIRKVERAYEKAATGALPRYRREVDSIGNATKGMFRPISDLFSSFTRLIGLGSLVAGFASVVVMAFTHKANAAKKLRNEIEDTRKSVTDLFDSLGNRETPGNALDQRARELEKIQKAYDEQLDKAKKIQAEETDGWKKAIAIQNAAWTGAFSARGRVESEFIRNRQAEESKSLTLSKKAALQAEYDIAKARATAIGGASGAILDMIAEEKKAYDTLSGESLQGRLAVIQIELEAKLAAIGAATKAQDDAAAESARKAAEAQEEAARRSAQAWRDAMRDIRDAQVGEFDAGQVSLPSVGGNLRVLSRQNTAIPVLGMEDY